MPRSTTAYRDVVTEDDHIRLRDWRMAFVSGLEAARKSGHGEEIARQGVLLEPDSALAGPAIPNGMYRCRVIKLGARDFVVAIRFSSRTALCAPSHPATHATVISRSVPSDCLSVAMT